MRRTTNSLENPPPQVGYYNSVTLTVKPGQSIQPAVDRARSDDRVKVFSGVYRELVVVDKGGISLIGAHVNSEPRFSRARTNLATLFNVGIPGGTNLIDGRQMVKLGKEVKRQ